MGRVLIFFRESSDRSLTTYIGVRSRRMLGRRFVGPPSIIYEDMLPRKVCAPCLLPFPFRRLEPFNSIRAAPDVDVHSSDTHLVP